MCMCVHERAAAESEFWFNKGHNEFFCKEEFNSVYACFEFVGRASWNFHPYRSVFLHLQHIEAGFQMWV